ncbi:MAG: filamentous hemagglutinin, partial [Verrucomicrobia bacterium]|nr:filamentous hemagglutinin [Verrucomicrobiota bacterium]
MNSKVYDGTRNATLSGAALVGASGNVGLGNTTTGTFASKNVGVSVPVTTSMTLTGSGASLFTLTQPNLVGTILAKPLSVFSASVASREYDGTANAGVSGAQLQNEAPGTGNATDGKYYTGDAVVLVGGGNGTFADKNVGSGKAVTTTMTLSGADAGNYTITQPTLTGSITRRTLTMGGTTIQSREYDGTTTA